MAIDFFGGRGFGDFVDQFSKLRIENSAMVQEQRKVTQEYEKQLEKVQRLLEVNKSKKQAIQDEIKENKRLKAIMLSNGKISQQAVAEIEKINARNEELQRALEARTRTIERHTRVATGLSEGVAEQHSRIESLIEAEQEGLNRIGKLTAGIGVGVGIFTSQWLRFTERTNEVKDTLGVSYETALQMQGAIQANTAELRLTGVQWENSLEAAKALYEVQGNLNDISSDQLRLVSLQAEKLGVAARDAAKVSRIFELNSELTKEQAASLTSYVGIMSEELGVGAAQVMEDIASNSAVAAKYFAGNPKALARAAIEARRLHLSLSDMESVANSLLDFESSIEKQFEAQVLTGKQLVLDRARTLALEGDIAGATKDILMQVGSISDFNQLNVIQRQAIADAAGLELGQLVDSLNKQEAINNMTAAQRQRYEELGVQLEANNQLTAEKLLLERQSQSVQDRYNSQIQALRENLSNGLLPIFIKITDFMTQHEGLVWGLAAAYGAVLLAKNAIILKDGILLAKEAALFLWAQRQAVATIFTETFRSMGKIPVAGALLGLGVAAAAIAAMNSNIQKVNDVQITPDRNVITGPAGTFELNPNDTIVAGTNLNQGQSQSSGITSGIERKLEELINLLKMSRPVNMDGIKVGEVLALAQTGGVS